MEMVIAVVIGAVLGILVGLLAGYGSRHGVETEKKVLEASNEEARQRLAEEKEENRRLMEEMKEEWNGRVVAARKEVEEQWQKIVAEKERSCKETLGAQERRHLEAMEAQETRFNLTVEKVREEMKAATEEMLRQRQKEFAESSSADLGQIVNPLRETIDRMKEAMNETTVKQTAMSSEMKANIENMMKQSEAARQSADELARVFKHGSKVQGDWGETVLDELLESQGLTRGIHYDTQEVIRDANGGVVHSETGSNLRPDVILHLDTKREVIIDSKVSLTAFMDYANAATEEERQKFLKAHVDSIRKHVKELSEKDYSSYIRPPKVRMDYVIMFVPHTGALWTALHAQPDLWRKAMDRNVFIADEQTLFAALRIISLTWTQIAQAQNHERLFELATEMMDRVGQFLKKYQAVGKALETAAKAYEEGERKLQPGGQSILQTCAKLQKLGARQSERNPLPRMEEMEVLPEVAGQPEEEGTAGKSDEIL